MFERLEILRINDSVKMSVEGYFSLLKTCDSTCTFRVSAVLVKIITFERFDKFNYFFWCFFNIITEIA